MAEPERPRAVRLGPQGDPAPASSGKPAGQGHATVIEETEPFDPAPAAATLQSPRPARLNWAGLLGSALAGLCLFAVGLWAERLVVELLGLYPVLGYVALALALAASLALLVILAGALRDMLRERRIEKLHARAQAALQAGNVDDARAVARELVALYASRPQTAAGRAALEAALPDLFAARDILGVAERTLLQPLDAAAKLEIARMARQVSLVTAVSPRALVDVTFVLVACTRLLRAIATVYGGRPGMLGLFRLARAVIGHLVLTGGMAAGDTLLQQLLGQGLAARLSAKLGEGVLNGLLTARIGLSAIAVCRPLPFVEANGPTLTDVAGDLVAWRAKEGS